MHDLALPLFERITSCNVEREHFLQRRAASAPGNLREAVPEWTGVSGGWKQGDASPRVAGPARSVAGAPGGP